MGQCLKHLFLFVTGGLLYNLVGLVWRGWTHWTMFFPGGLCFTVPGLINEIIPRRMLLQQQLVIGGCIISGLEFITGCIVNLWFGWAVWDYGQMPGNILGRICPQFFVLWLPAALAGIVLDDWLRYWLFHEERPHYKF